MQGVIEDPQAALRFLLAGNCTTTFVSQKTSARFTYKIKLAPKKEDETGIKYFVSLLTGPNNEEDYSLIGLIVCQGTRSDFYLTKKAKAAGLGVSTPSVRAMNWVLGHLPGVPPQTEIWHEGRCGRCGRLLTVPESVENSLYNGGLGPECEKLS